MTIKTYNIFTHSELENLIRSHFLNRDFELVEFIREDQIHRFDGLSEGPTISAFFHDMGLSDLLQALVNDEALPEGNLMIVQSQ